MTEREIRVGDRYLIEVEVAGTSSSEPRFRLGGDDPGQLSSWVSTKILRAGKLIEKPLQVGDRVRLRCGGTEGEIKALEGKVAWVKWPGHYMTEALCDLERAP